MASTKLKFRNIVCVIYLLIVFYVFYSLFHTAYNAATNISTIVVSNYTVSLLILYARSFIDIDIPPPLVLKRFYDEHINSDNNIVYQSSRNNRYSHGHSGSISVNSADNSLNSNSFAAINSKTNNRKKLLCTSFMQLSNNSISFLLENMKTVRSNCDWVVMIYKRKSDPNQIELLSKRLDELVTQFGINIRIHFAIDRDVLLREFLSYNFSDSKLRFANALNSYKYTDSKNSASNSYGGSRAVGISEEEITNNNLYSKIETVEELVSILPYNKAVYPKALMFPQLLPYLNRYERVWLLDSDLLLKNFDVKRMLIIAECSFDVAPIVFQPLIAEDTQAYSFLSYDRWMSSAKDSGVLFAESVFVEIQAPVIDTKFFEWFIHSFIEPSFTTAIILGADWGYDELFCDAAKYYKIVSDSISNRNSSELPDGSTPRAENMIRKKSAYNRQNIPNLPPLCGLVIGSAPLHHNNSKETNNIVGVEGKKVLNNELMAIMREIYSSFIRPWNSDEANPLHTSSPFRKATKLRGNCILSNY